MNTRQMFVVLDGRISILEYRMDIKFIFGCWIRASKGLELVSSAEKPNRLHSERMVLATGDVEGNVLIWNVLDASITRSITGII